MENKNIHCLNTLFKDFKKRQFNSSIRYNIHAVKNDQIRFCEILSAGELINIWYKKVDRSVEQQMSLSLCLTRYGNDNNVGNQVNRIP